MKIHKTCQSRPSSRAEKMLGLLKDTRLDEPTWCYLCGEAVLPGPDYTVHLTTAHEKVHVSPAAQEEEEEEDVIEEQVEAQQEEDEEEGDVIEDPVACYLCGETVLPGQDYKVHLAAAHRLTKVRIEL